MDLNDMFGSLGLEDGGAQNSALDMFYKLNPDVEIIPRPLLEDIIWRYLRSQPIHRFFVLRCVCKHFKEFLTAPKSLQAHPVPESWMLKPKCVRSSAGSSDNTVYLDTYDALKKKVQLIPVPAHIASCQGRAGWISTDELRVSSSQGGENGLVFLEKFGNSNSDLRECFVFNPMTKSWRQLRLHRSVQQIDRFGSRYLSWASNGGEEMFPLLLDPVTDIWNRIGSGFTTRGPIRKEKAVVNEVVYQRYQGCTRDLKDQLIIYDMRDQTFREEATTGLPDTMVNEHLFQHEGHIYLATVELFQPTAWKLLLYEFKTTNLELNWEKVSEIPAPLLQEVTIPYPALTQMKFFHMDHELLVASFVSKRRSDGVHVLVHGARSPCHAIVTYDLTSQSWRKDSESRLGPRLHVSTTVFRPRLDIEA